jgi:hypothetical protein
MAKKSSRKAHSTANEVAKAMAENMAANMKDPDFEINRERALDDAAKLALAKHKTEIGPASKNAP